MTNFVAKVSTRIHFILKFPEFGQIKNNWQNNIQFGQKAAREKHAPLEPTKKE